MLPRQCQAPPASQAPLSEALTFTSLCLCCKVDRSPSLAARCCSASVSSAASSQVLSSARFWARAACCSCSVCGREQREGGKRAVSTGAALPPRTLLKSKARGYSWSTFLEVRMQHRKQLLQLSRGSLPLSCLHAAERG